YERADRQTSECDRALPGGVVPALAQGAGAADRAPNRFVARQVEPEPEDRDALRAATGTDEIPVLVAGGERICGEDDAIAWLDERYDSSRFEEDHRDKFREHEVEAGG